MASTRFIVSVHLLCALGLLEGRPVRSDAIAASVNTNPAVVRRLFGQLGDAGLVRAQLGQGGGFLLAKPTDGITLWSVFQAVEDTTLFPPHRGEPSVDCPIGRHILAALADPLARVERAFAAELARVTIADIVRDIRDRSAIV
ncbi:MAG: Rrf2 family transcriptional regulator [Alphaproteobacteria bacterium]|nr:Rrf2 family transcriptional regulator [Alphaproteobacteria bacterium]TAD91677.1 MAG: Rrf2 family transcriptional regulator [Alphaproteobacteria bacterium]